VPALLRGSRVPRNNRVAQLTADVDRAATTVDASGATPRHTLDGVSLLALARQPSQLAAATSCWPTARERLKSPIRGDPHARAYKYVESATGERELYDLRRDRFEQRSAHAVPLPERVTAPDG
jgi:arylsulfatase A-like enzyme